VNPGAGFKQLRRRRVVRGVIHDDDLAPAIDYVRTRRQSEHQASDIIPGVVVDDHDGDDGPCNLTLGSMVGRGTVHDGTRRDKGTKTRQTFSE
jgi:hypothetical protein